MGEAQRRAGVLYDYPRTGHAGVGVSWRIASCSDIVSDLMQCLVDCKRSQH
jgi:hypothetical protein